MFNIIHDRIRKVTKKFPQSSSHLRFYLLKLCAISVIHFQVFKIFTAKMDLLVTKYVLEHEMAVEPRSLDPPSDETPKTVPRATKNETF